MYENAHSVVVDEEWRLLAQYQFENLWVAMQDGNFRIYEDMLAHLLDVWLDDCLHL